MVYYFTGYKEVSPTSDMQVQIYYDHLNPGIWLSTRRIHRDPHPRLNWKDDVHTILLKPAKAPRSYQAQPFVIEANRRLTFIAQAASLRDFDRVMRLVQPRT